MGVKLMGFSRSRSRSLYDRGAPQLICFCAKEEDVMNEQNM